MGLNIRPSFYIYDKAGNKIKSIKKSFIKKIHITSYDLQQKVIVNNNKLYKLIIDDRAIEAEIGLSNTCHCIVSFQEHEFGNYAIARIIREVKQAQTVEDRV